MIGNRNRRGPALISLNLQVTFLDTWKLDDCDEVLALLENVNRRERPHAGHRITEPIALQPSVKRPLQPKQQVNRSCSWPDPKSVFPLSGIRFGRSVRAVKPKGGAPEAARALMPGLSAMSQLESQSDQYWRTRTINEAQLQCFTVLRLICNCGRTTDYPLVLLLQRKNVTPETRRSNTR